MQSHKSINRIDYYIIFIIITSWLGTQFTLINYLEIAVYFVTITNIIILLLYYNINNNMQIYD